MLSTMTGSLNAKNITDEDDEERFTSYCGGDKESFTRRAKELACSKNNYSGGLSGGPLRVYDSYLHRNDCVHEVKTAFTLLRELILITKENNFINLLKKIHNSDSDSFIMWCSDEGYSDTLSVFNLNKKDTDLKTYLHHACSGQYPYRTAELISSGCEIHCKDKDGILPIDFLAPLKEHESAVFFLMKAIYKILGQSNKIKLDIGNFKRILPDYKDLTLQIIRGIICSSEIELTLDMVKNLLSHSVLSEIGNDKIVEIVQGACKLSSDSKHTKSIEDYLEDQVTIAVTKTELQKSSSNFSGSLYPNRQSPNLNSNHTQRNEEYSKKKF